jgi:hypothetical protein
VDNQIALSDTFTTMRARGLRSHADAEPVTIISIAADGTICRGGDATASIGSMLDGIGQLLTHDGTNPTVLQPGTAGQVLTIGAGNNVEWVEFEVPSELPITKGVIITGDGTTSTQLAVGTTGQALVADEAAPNGIKWGGMSHFALTDRGTNSHASIDSFISSKGQASGVAEVGPTAAYGTLIGPFLHPRHQPAQMRFCYESAMATRSNNGLANDGFYPTIENWTQVYSNMGDDFSTTFGQWVPARNGVVISDLYVWFDNVASSGPPRWNMISLNRSAENGYDSCTAISTQAGKHDYVKLTTLMLVGAGESIDVSAGGFGNGLNDGSGDTVPFYARWSVCYLGL